MKSVNFVLECSALYKNKSTSGRCCLARWACMRMYLRFSELEKNVKMHVVLRSRNPKISSREPQPIRPNWRKAWRECDQKRANNTHLHAHERFNFEYDWQESWDGVTPESALSINKALLYFCDLKPFSKNYFTRVQMHRNATMNKRGLGVQGMGHRAFHHPQKYTRTTKQKN